MSEDLYTQSDSEYLKKTSTWHEEDSPWKAKQILSMLNKNSIAPKKVVEIGCGAGEILNQLSELLIDDTIEFEGYDIAPDAYKLAKLKSKNNLTFFQEDLLLKKDKKYDVLLVIDVFEHVPDYLGFINKCGSMADYKIYHIPIDITVSSILRNQLIPVRNSVGHLHYYTKETAIATIKDSGQEILDCFYTAGALELPNRKLRTKIANIPRKLLYKMAPNLAVRLIGGYSLMVLAK